MGNDRDRRDGRRGRQGFGATGVIGQGMSLWGVHVGFGALVTLLVVSRLGWTRTRRWIAVAVSGFWAIGPDLYHFVPGTRAWYKPAVHDSWMANLFWLHGVFDTLDRGDSSLYSASMVLAILVGFLVVEYRA